LLENSKLFASPRTQFYKNAALYGKEYMLYLRWEIKLAIKFLAIMFS
jgi:hypothetical protein